MPRQEVDQKKTSTQAKGMIMEVSGNHNATKGTNQSMKNNNNNNNNNDNLFFLF